MNLVTENKKTNWWQSGYKICYVLLNDIFDCCNRCEGSQEKISRAALLALDSRLALPSYMKNLKRTV